MDSFEGSADFADAIRAQIEELEKQQIDLADRLAKAQEDIHRYQAEIQNLHRRREKETEDAGKYAITKFARDTVEVADNFERAIASVPDGATNDNPVLQSLLDGVTMTERQFLSVLERHGVKRISPKDELFNPHQHQAMMEQEDRAVPAGTVLQVFQSGYIIADRVLRPAMVVVAKGGPKPVKPEPVEEVEATSAAQTSPEPQAGDTGDAPTSEPPAEPGSTTDGANDNT
ncbi:MAG: nucleotide exchange factor GrpE [Alphaproteobacteria bacterium]|nr:nucleotide exchange factor GrpE [Alphaproteobacteria bacterium]